jgi:hypothetical protein
MAFHQSTVDVEEMVNKVMVKPVKAIRKVEIKVEVKKEDKVMEEVEVVPEVLVSMESMLPMLHALSVMKNGINLAIIDVLTFKEKDRLYLGVVEDELLDGDMDVKVWEEVVELLL